MPNADGPLAADEIDRLLTPLAAARGVALAVSGGPDSTALLVLAAEWIARRSDPPRTVVLTVDHGLRAESAPEAAEVARKAARLGLAHETLRWTGDKPASNLQAAARAARYRLLVAAAEAHGCDWLVTGHTRDDQAETFLLNLARGSGVYGLAAMPVARRLDRITLFRPLLDIPKSRLIASLEARGETWAEDPSNEDPRFQRVKVRRALRELGTLGLGRERLADTARRLARAAAALDHAVDRLIAAAGLEHPAGFARIDAGALAREPEEIRLRTLARLLRHVGGGRYPPRLDRLEALAASASGPPPLKRTLAGDVAERIGADLWVYREPGRAGLPRLRLEPGTSATWDDRFRIAVPQAFPAPVEIGPLGLREAKAMVHATVPARVLATVPAARMGDRIVGLPAGVATETAVMIARIGADANGLA